MAQTILHNLDEFARAIRAHPRIFLFKHSPVCPVSAAALVEWQAFGTAARSVPTLFVDVIADRPTARGIAGACGVQHESPQAILFADGAAVWHASHDAITTAALQQAWAALDS